MQVQPYLFFDGRCDEALEFYKKTLGAEVLFLMRFKDAPPMPNQEGCAGGNAPPGDKVMHSSIRIGETTMMASDGRSTGHPEFKGFTLSIATPTVAEAERLFAAIGEGGQVQMPMAKTFFSPAFGMVADKFGVSWMILVETGQKPGGGGASGEAKPFVISREFNAPRDLVWKAWTERDRLMKWFGPKGFTMTTAKLDFRPGGTFHYALRSADGKEMWGKFIYREIAAPERITLVNSFSDEKGGLTRHPFAPDWPIQMLSTTTLAEKSGKTTVTIQWSPLDPSPAELKTFNESQDGMKQGWTGTFDQLEEYLRKA